MICVLLSTYNGEKYLDDQLESLCNQVGVDLKILIRDDGSTDSTHEVIKRWREKFPNMFDFLQGKNVGFAMSFTYLLQVAIEKYPDVEYYAFCDQDDVWLPDKIKVAVERLKEDEMSDIPVTYCSNTTQVDEELNKIRLSWKPGKVCLTKERSMIQSYAVGCTMVFNKKAADIYVSHVPRDLRVHDFLMFQLCMFLGKVIYDDTPHILYRQHHNNSIGRPGFLGRCRKRMKGHYKQRTLEIQNYYFLEAYKDLLAISDIETLSIIVFYRRNIFTRLSLLFNRKIRYDTFESNFFYMLKILIGKV